MAEKRLWKTKPLECWTKAKEVKKARFNGITTAHERGELACLWGLGVEAGFGNTCHSITGEHYGANSANMGLSEEFGEAAEAKGYARDVCAYMRVNLGSMFLNKYAFGGPFPKIDFVARTHHCDTHAKWALVEAEFLKVPYYCTEGAETNQFDSVQSQKNKVDYVIGQTLDAIEWMEKTTSRKFDDEAYIKDMYHHAHTQNLWGQVILMNQHIPAPLDEKTMFSFYQLSGYEGGDEIYRMLRDEVADRVRNEIAAVATERYRVMHVSQPIWHALSNFRYIQKYGAVSVGSRYCFGMGGGTMLKGEIEVAVPTLEEQGIVIKTREDAIRAMVERRFVSDGTGRSHRYVGQVSREAQVRMARLWHCDGAIMHMNRGCEGWAIGEPQIRLALQENNIPVLSYEGNVADSREFDEARTRARIDAFFESQGLEKLED
ncbi:MAG: 2-hydroxyacyl-CoA dehydratase [Chloroflexi bacterium]|nr:2-hydroxyacyl-CoA dehydratase [Chloroflexota bacterium]